MLNIPDLFRRAYPTGTRTLYVSGAGDDAHDGSSPANAKRSIQAAVDVAAAGDRILVGSGIYGYTSVYDKHGRPGAWITIEGIAGAEPVVDVSAFPARWDSTKMTNGIDIQTSSYVAVLGLEVRGQQTSHDDNPSGIAVFRGSKNVGIWGCHVHDFPGGGINCFHQAATASDGGVLPAGGWDAVDVFFNTVHGTSKFSPYNTSGISFYGGADLTSTIDGRYGYRAVGNYVYDVMCTVPYRPGGQRFVTDGNGISPDSLAVPNNLNPDLRPYLKRGLVEGNVIVACGGRGVHVFNTKNVDVVNNTLIGNLRSNSPAINGSTEVDLHLDVADQWNGVVIANNLIVPTNTTRAFDRAAQTVQGNTATGGADAVPSGNQSLRSMGARLFSTPIDEHTLVAGVPASSLCPAVSTLVARVPGSLGYQVLGIGKQTGNSVAVGALPQR